MLPADTFWVPTTAVGYTRDRASSGRLAARSGELSTAASNGRGTAGSSHPPGWGQGEAIGIRGCDGTKAGMHQHAGMGQSRAEDSGAGLSRGRALARALATGERREAKGSVTGWRVECTVTMLALAVWQNRNRGLGRLHGQKPRERKRNLSSGRGGSGGLTTQARDRRQAWSDPSTALPVARDCRRACGSRRALDGSLGTGSTGSTGTTGTMGSARRLELKLRCSTQSRVWSWARKSDIISSAAASSCARASRPRAGTTPARPHALSTPTPSLPLLPPRRFARRRGLATPPRFLPPVIAARIGLARGRQKQAQFADAAPSALGRPVAASSVQYEHPGPSLLSAATLGHGGRRRARGFLCAILPNTCQYDLAACGSAKLRILCSRAPHCCTQSRHVAAIFRTRPVQP